MNGLADEFLDLNVFAVAGVSSNPEKYGTKCYRDLVAVGKRVFGINPRLDMLDGQPIYPDVKSLPETPDVLVLVVPAKVGLALVEQAAETGIARVWMQPGAESDELLAACARLGLQVVHNDCVMRQLARRRQN